MQQFKRALCDRFKNNAASIQKRGGNTQQEINKLSQEEGDTLAKYHERAQSLLWRGHSRDAPTLGEPALTPLEAEVLSNLIYIFVSGIRDPELRKSIVKSGTREGRLSGTFTMAEDLRLSLERDNEMERKIEGRKEFVMLRDHYKRQRGQSITSASASFRNIEERPPQNYSLVRRDEQQEAARPQPGAGGSRFTKE
ncbi:hypothetical protein K3495_g7565 [Podosphaera aphanis]|nr:hypothetical protein K3495_g7565 [Podosphaera aphanis]